MRARSRERDYLGRDTISLQHPLPIHDVPMPRHRHVVIAGVVKARVAFRINCNPDYTVAAAKRVEIFRRIKMVVNVDQAGQLARK